MSGASDGVGVFCWVTGDCGCAAFMSALEAGCGAASGEAGSAGWFGSGVAVDVSAFDGGCGVSDGTDPHRGPGWYRSSTL